MGVVSRRLLTAEPKPRCGFGGIYTRLLEQDDWIAGRTLAEVRLRDERIDVLGIQRATGEYVGIPHGRDRVNARDVLVLYSTEQQLAELDERKRGAAGDEAHREASGFSEAVAG